MPWVSFLPARLLPAHFPLTLGLGLFIPITRRRPTAVTTVLSEQIFQRFHTSFKGEDNLPKTLDEFDYSLGALFIDLKYLFTFHKLVPSNRRGARASGGM
jgi:hypothetical protein